MKLFYFYGLLVVAFLIQSFTSRNIKWEFIILLGLFLLVFSSQIARDATKFKAIVLLVFAGGILLNLFLVINIPSAAPLSPDAALSVRVDAVYQYQYLVSITSKNSNRKIWLNKYSFEKKSETEAFVGDAIKSCFQTKLINYQQPDSFKHFLKSKQVSYTGWMTDACETKVVRNNKIYYFLQNKKSKDWINYLLFQKKTKTLDNVFEKIKDLGISHIFVVSGFHLLALSQIFFFFSNRQSKRFWKWFWITVALLICFFLTFLTNWKISSVKALILISYFAIKKIVKPRYDPFFEEEIPLLCLAFLCVNPMLIFNIGFQLSFLISWVLLLGRPKNDWGFQKWSSGLRGFVEKQFIILLTIMPIILSMNYRISFFAAFFAIGYAVFFIFFYPLFLLTVLLPFSDSLHQPIFALIEASVNFFAKWNFFIPFGEWIGASLIFYYAFVFGFFFIRHRTNTNWSVMLWPSWLILLSIIFFFSWTRHPYYRFHMIDVGHGMAMFLQSPDKQNNILFDAGSGRYWEQTRTKTIANYLKKINVSRLNTIFISHNDNDHINNLRYLQEVFFIDRIVTNQNQAPRYRSREIVIDNLAFSYYQKMMTENNKSLVLQFTVTEINFLLTFDAEKPAENELRNSHRIKRNIDIFQVGHHGSKTSSTSDFIDYINPRRCLISAAVVAAQEKSLQEHGCQIYNTHIDGNIIIELTPSGIVVTTKKF